MIEEKYLEIHVFNRSGHDCFQKIFLPAAVTVQTSEDAFEYLYNMIIYTRIVSHSADIHNFILTLGRMFITTDIVV